MTSQRFIAAGLAAVVASGCATIIKGGRNELVLNGAPDGLEVYAHNERLELSLAGTDGAGNPRYKAMVPREAQKLTLKQAGGEVQVPLQTHLGVGWLVGDLFCTVFGILIDAASSKWFELDDLDVGAALAAAPHAPAAQVASAPAAQNPAWRAPEPVAPAPVVASHRPAEVEREPAAPAQTAVITSGKLAVLDFKNYAKDLKPEDVRYFTDLVRGATLRAAKGVEVITRENLIVLLQATGRDIEKCEGECEVDTGRRIGADAVVSGDVLKVGSRYKMSLKLHETRGGRLLSTAIASGKSIDELDDALQVAAQELMKPTK
jgi:hypothetical protein